MTVTVRPLGANWQTLLLGLVAVNLVCAPISWIDDGVTPSWIVYPLVWLVGLWLMWRRLTYPTATPTASGIASLSSLAMPQRDQLGRSAKHLLEHRRSQPSGEGVLLAGVIATKQPQSVDQDLPAMAEPRPR